LIALSMNLKSGDISDLAKFVPGATCGVLVFFFIFFCFR